MTQPHTTLIKGGTVVTSQDVLVQDILIQGEHIFEIGTRIDFKADQEFDAQGLLVFPGAVDTHVHFNDSFMNTVSVHDFYSGTLAAAYGGVTSIIDFANQQKGQSLQEALFHKKEEAQGQALIDWGVHPVITDPTHKTLSEIPLMIKGGAPTIKCYMTYRQEGLLIEDKKLKLILETLGKSGGKLLVHAEDNKTIEKNVSAVINSGQTKPIFHAKSRPVEAETRAIERCIKMTRETNGRLFIVHLASDKGIELVHQAQKDGIHVHAETCTHYLIFTDKHLEREDGIKWICSPPLRNLQIQAKLWEGLKNGQISLVSSDDAAYSWEAKLMGKQRFDKCPNGIPGIEPRLNILYSEGVVKGKLSLQRFVDVVSTQPAKLFGLAPQKGHLTKGADADIVLFDPTKTWTMGKATLHMASDWSAYEGFKITGKIEKVFSRGELIVDGEFCLAQKGRGRYLHRKLND
ncbi:dihydropyrimidinase [Acidobacteriota bacterium]